MYFIDILALSQCDFIYLNTQNRSDILVYSEINSALFFHYKTLGSSIGLSLLAGCGQIHDLQRESVEWHGVFL